MNGTALGYLGCSPEEAETRKKCRMKRYNHRTYSDGDVVSVGEGTKPKE
jgi:hypothetical protein